MISNYLKIAFRNITKNSVSSLINIMGLSLGMAAFILILQYITFEKSVNSFHSNLPVLYRMLSEGKDGGNSPFVSPAFGVLSKQQFSEITNVCRVAPGLGSGVLTYDDGQKDKSFREENLVYADGNFFEVFSFKISAGDKNSLTQPNTVAISQSMATKYFDKQDPLGKIVTLNNQFGKTLYTVIAVFEDMPENSDIRHDLVFSIQTLANPANLNGSTWASLDGLETQFLNTYIQTQTGIDHLALEEKMNTFKKSIQPKSDESVRLQPMANIHLASSLSENYTTSGNIRFIYLLGSIGLLILAIAWFNYINLSTASALKRAKEIGIRKVTGASRAQLVRQLLSESLLLNIFALGIALALVNIFQTFYNQLIEKDLSLTILGENWFWLGGLLLILAGSIASGSYSAFALSSFRPVQVLKGVFSKSAKGIWLRKTLVVFQFSISILLIASTFILYRQLQFMQHSDLGLNAEQLVVIRGAEVEKDSTFTQRSQGFEHELSQLSFISKYTTTGSVPGSWYNFSTASITKLKNPLIDDEKLNYAFAIVDDRFLDTYEIPLVAGKNFTPEMCAKSWNGDKIMVNERALQQLGFETPEEAVGEKILWEKKEYEITGVVKNYHHMSLHQAIDPVIFFPDYNQHYFTARLETSDMATNISKLEALYKKNFPGNPFEFFFVNDKYADQYRTEQQYGLIFTIASCLAIFIASLGLFGLATFTVEQRVKEIGIRKVLGANVLQISTLLSKEFLVLVCISLAIATPLSWWSMSQWLQGFAYQIEISWWFFAVAGLISVVIALATVSSQSIKAAVANPIKSLRNE